MHKSKSLAPSNKLCCWGVASSPKGEGTQRLASVHKLTSCGLPTPEKETISKDVVADGAPLTELPINVLVSMGHIIREGTEAWDKPITTRAHNHATVLWIKGNAPLSIE